MLSCGILSCLPVQLCAGASLRSSGVLGPARCSKSSSMPFRLCFPKARLYTYIRLRHLSIMSVDSCFAESRLTLTRVPGF
ncbi:hypothetical protein C8Q74DRAFT_1246812 [Fomes fomentarius]|nr:hypothetical protein C8Q74DRAFT_1246812 [Fomes fomentarius]